MSDMVLEILPRGMKIHAAACLLKIVLGVIEQSNFSIRPKRSASDLEEQAVEFEATAAQVEVLSYVVEEWAKQRAGKYLRITLDANRTILRGILLHV